MANNKRIVALAGLVGALAGLVMAIGNAIRQCPTLHR